MAEQPAPAQYMRSVRVRTLAGSTVFVGFRSSFTAVTVATVLASPMLAAADADAAATGRMVRLDTGAVLAGEATLATAGIEEGGRAGLGLLLGGKGDATPAELEQLTASLNV